jgi:hypothetical protein
MAQMRAPFLMSVAMSVNLIMLCSANEFLKQPANKLIERVSEQDIQVSLLDEVEKSLGEGSATKRLSQMEAMLRPIVAALPKNEHGNMGHSAVRYALHRLFVLRHGWAIKGLHSAGGAWNSSSPSGVLTDQVPAYIEGLFEKRLAGKGFGLHEVALLAATIEHLIHNEAVSRLGHAFNLYSLPVTSSLTEAEVMEVLDTYMMAFILGEDMNNMTQNMARTLTSKMPEVFLAWQDTRNFVQGIRQNITKAEGDTADFAHIARIAEAIGEDFGSFQDFECRQLKDSLLKMEYRGTGRALLSDFYKPALDGAWTFQESVGYLRTLGLLDESDPERPSVIIANYIASHANCIANSGFYSVCCKNECEDLLGRLEQSIGSYEAKPATIASLVADINSSTVAAPQTLSASLLQRLDEIAASNGGMVPLHGRLFAQFLHHVYPRECPFPHLSGTADTKPPLDFLDESGIDPTATEEEMLQFVVNTTSDIGKSDLAVEDVSPWTTEEELFVSRPQFQLASAGDTSASIPAHLRSVALLAASGSLAFALIQMVKTPMGTPIGGVSQQKYTI